MSDYDTWEEFDRDFPERTPAKVSLWLRDKEQRKMSDPVVEAIEQETT